MQFLTTLAALSSLALGTLAADSAQVLLVPDVIARLTATSASVVGVTSCTATYVVNLSSRSVSNVPLTVTAAPNAVTYRMSFSSNKVGLSVSETCSIDGTKSAACNGQGTYSILGIPYKPTLSTTLNSDALKSAYTAIPVKGNAGALSATSTCTSGAQASMASAMPSNSKNAAGPQVIEKTVYKVAVIPAVAAAVGALL